MHHTAADRTQWLRNCSWPPGTVAAARSKRLRCPVPRTRAIITDLVYIYSTLRSGLRQFLSVRILTRKVASAEPLYSVTLTRLLVPPPEEEEKISFFDKPVLTHWPASKLALVVILPTHILLLFTDNEGRSDSWIRRHNTPDPAVSSSLRELGLSQFHIVLK